MDTEEYLSVVLLVGLTLLIFCYAKNSEGFGSDNKPFEPDNMVMMENPFDNIDYIRPVFLTHV